MKRVWSRLNSVGVLLVTPTLSRSLIALIALAITLLLAVNVATFVMIQRTIAYNDTVDQSQNVRLAGKDLLNLLVDAETGQRGFMLTGRSEYLAIHDQAIAALPRTIERLHQLLRDDVEMAPRLERVRDLYKRRLSLSEQTIELARTGRIGEAVALIRSGEGKVLMDAMRVELSSIDKTEAARLVARTRRSEASSQWTVAVNFIAALLILILAAISIWLVRRYVDEIEQARQEVARANAGLESQVRERTAELTRANEEIQRFAYIVSHDLRSPLVNVMGYTSELEHVGIALDSKLTALEKIHPDAVDQETARAVREDVPEAVNFIRASTAKMDRLINAILQLSREGRRPPASIPLPMTEIIEGIAASVSHQVIEADGDIIVRDLPEISSDRLGIEQIFGNLIDNAVKYHQPGRPIHIVVEGEDLPDGWVAYRVIDNGRGVSQRDYERVFELFRRAGKQDQPGEGLGLAFVRATARRLGGTIDLQSELGKGSTFHLKLPKRLKVSSELGVNS